MTLTEAGGHQAASPSSAEARREVIELAEAFDARNSARDRARSR